MRTTDSPDQPTDDAPFPRYFVHVRGFSRRSLFIRFDEPDDLVAVLANGTEFRIKSMPLDWAVRLADKGTLREITARDADTLIARANVQREHQSTGARRSKV